eukprot:CAMPEP_0174930224 /NCGR_PEP_ID=MMETSP1355-20121228/30826_1 /TAXON_ID=464990 /ORGANISM="Hemiselmis tepida, Strain CCMP443" /LENGTH=58 /DNA_ID=CAMNT_0016176501 /DNA_START=61 /DNA_END=234 /DNA_ORIENTATION=-
MDPSGSDFPPTDLHLLSPSLSPSHTFLNPVHSPNLPLLDHHSLDDPGTRHLDDWHGSG